MDHKGLREGAASRPCRDAAPYKAKTEEAGLPTESGYIPAAATKTGLALKQNGRPEFKRDARFVFL